MEQTPIDEKTDALRELFGSIGAVVKAGFEDGHTDTPVLELPDETITKAGEIYDASKPD